MRQPNLNSLRMFDAAARHLNFRLAAEELNLTQGAVAQQVRRLEAELGQKLFHRQARGLALTAAGSGYHQPVRKAFALIEQATRQLTTEQSHATLSVPPSFAAKWLVPRLGLFQQAHPDIELQVVAAEAIASFQSDGIDCAVRQGPVPSDIGVLNKLLAPLDLRAVSSVDFAQSMGDAQTLADLGEYPLVQDGHRHWDALANADTIKPRHRMLQFNQTGLAMDAAKNGHGIALIPGIYLSGSAEVDGLVTLCSIEDDGVTGFHLVWPNSKPMSVAQQRVHEWLTHEFVAATKTREP